MIMHTKKTAPTAANTYQLIPQDNTPFRVNELDLACENLRCPRFAALRERFAIDTAVENVSGEFERILALRHWIAERIRIDDDNPTRVDHQDAWYILEAAEKGGGFHCAHFRLVQQAVMSAYGYVTRCLGVGDGRLEHGRHHGVNEVWVNQLGKWVLSDAKYDLHFEKDGVPLSALEMRDEVIKDGAASVQRAYGPGRKPTKGDNCGKFETYRWLSWELIGDTFSSFPRHRSSALVFYEDDYTRQHTWYRDGQPHWAYEGGFFVRTTHRNWIEWTPNVLQSRVAIEDNRAVIALTSCTPNLKSYQVTTDRGRTWSDCPATYHLDLSPAGWSGAFRCVNLAGVAGPEHRVVIAAIV